MGCDHNDEYECNDCTEAAHAEAHPERVDGCAHCWLSGTIQLSPKATPSKQSKAPPTVHTSMNSWESGIARDERGMPFLGKGGQPIGVKEYGERRSEIDAWRHRLKTDPTVLTETGS
jgi:hypothetical protein